MSGDILYVCKKHYYLLVSRGKVNDFLPSSEGRCMMMGCRNQVFRRILIGKTGRAKEVYIRKDGSLYEETVTTLGGV